MEIGLIVLIASAILIYAAIERVFRRKWGENPNGIRQIFKRRIR